MTLNLSNLLTGQTTQDVDMNDLCAAFASNARCDGTKVVLEPQGVTHILETFLREIT